MKSKNEETIDSLWNMIMAKLKTKCHRAQMEMDTQLIMEISKMKEKVVTPQIALRLEIWIKRMNILLKSSIESLTNSSTFTLITIIFKYPHKRNVEKWRVISLQIYNQQSAKIIFINSERSKIMMKNEKDKTSQTTDNEDLNEVILKIY